MTLLRMIIDAVRALGARFRSDARGNVAIIFAFSSVAILVGVGAGLDLSRAYMARQKVSEVATLTCQYANRSSVTATETASGHSAYLATVNAYAAKALSEQNWTGNSATDVSGQNNYFTATAPVSPSTLPTGAVTEIQSNVQTSFLNIIHVPTIKVHSRVGCQNASTAPNAGGKGGGGGGTIILSEGFETPCSNYCFTSPSGLSGTSSSPTSTFPSGASYTGDGGTQWYILGYCLETDIVGIISGSDPQGTHSAELDCDNGQGSAGNSSISTQLALATGYYEIRWSYRARVEYTDYDPAYICGTTAGDVSWANSTNAYNFNSALRTNQVNVYLDPVVSNSPPLHTTLDGSQQLGGSNLIDECVYSYSWVQRSIKINVTTAGNYWLSFAADGANDSYGGQIDNIIVCIDSCASSLQDNFPSTWLAANNGGVNKLLFEDTFETNPSYPQDTPNTHDIAKTHNLSASYGTSGSSSTSGWPLQSATGWGTAPFNQVTYGVLQGAAQGQQYIMLDGYNANGDTHRNRLISRPFLLDPGYYQVSYDYLSIVNFNIPSLPSFCVASPQTGVIFTQPGNSTGTIRYYNSITTSGDTNAEGVFLSNGQLVSTPLVANAPWSTANNTSSAAFAQGVATTYTNPDGSVSSTPTVPPDSVNYENYNANVVNPLIDMCGYADNWQWIPRSVSVKITKPGIYWLSLSANGGTADGNGAAIDDVKLTALGSPSMQPPSSALTTIPVPDPQPDTNYTNNGAFSGFYIVADPFKPTAADQ